MFVLRCAAFFIQGILLYHSALSLHCTGLFRCMHLLTQIPARLLMYYSCLPVCTNNESSFVKVNLIFSIYKLPDCHYALLQSDVIRVINNLNSQNVTSNMVTLSSRATNIVECIYLLLAGTPLCKPIFALSNCRSLIDVRYQIRFLNVTF